MDQIAVYNMALGRVGISQFVSSLTEKSNQAIVCGIYYDNCLQRVLTAYPWNFASRYKPLADIGLPPNHYKFRYQYPNDCLKVRILMLQLSSIPTAISQQVIRFGESQNIPFQVVENEPDNGKAIVTNLANAQSWYTANITNLNMWSPDATSALAWLLASEIAGPLSAQPEYAKMAGDAYKQAILEAGALNLNEGNAYINKESEILDARN